MKTNLLIIALLLGVIACKKKNDQPVKQLPPEQAPPKGKMDGTFKWYSGDSATTDLVLTTHLLNVYCSLCGVYMDQYYSNLSIAKIMPPYYACLANYKTDTLKFFRNSKTFIYVRKI